jgi:xylose isomerase
MEDHLRFAVACWHSFARSGGDPFNDGKAQDWYESVD